MNNEIQEQTLSEVIRLVGTVKTANKTKLVDVLTKALMPNVISIDFEDVKKVISPNDTVQIAEGVGGTCIIATENALKELSGIKVKKMLCIVAGDENTELSDISDALDLLDGTVAAAEAIMACLILDELPGVKVSIVASVAV